MKKIFLVMVFSLLLLAACENGTGNVVEEPGVDEESEGIDELYHDGESVRIYYVGSRTCPICTNLAEPFLDEMEEKYDVEVFRFETTTAEGREMSQVVAEEYGKEIRGVPHIFLGFEDWVGFSNDGRSAASIESKITECLESGCEDPLVR